MAGRFHGGKKSLTTIPSPQKKKKITVVLPKKRVTQDSESPRRGGEKGYLRDGAKEKTPAEDFPLGKGKAREA